MAVHLLDAGIFDVAKVEIKKTEKGYAIHLWDGDHYVPTTTLYIYNDIQSDKKVELVVEGLWEVEEEGGE